VLTSRLAEFICKQTARGVGEPDQTVKVALPARFHNGRTLIVLLVVVHRSLLIGLLAGTGCLFFLAFRSHTGV